MSALSPVGNARVAEATPVASPELKELETRGLSAREAADRLLGHGPNELASSRPRSSAAIAREILKESSHKVLPGSKFSSCGKIKHHGRTSRGSTRIEDTRLKEEAPMLQLPMFPGGDGIHPLLIHFPLTLFFLAPVFALLAASTKAATRRAFLLSTLLLMLLGTISTYVAFEAGEAAITEGLTKEALAMVDRHREFADLTRSSFTLATLLFGLTLAICSSLHLRIRELTGVLPLGVAAFYVFGLFWLIHTAYQGERLVHEIGVGTLGIPAP
jgi:uncharacterized membrane protein